MVLRRHAPPRRPILCSTAAIILFQAFALVLCVALSSSEVAADANGTWTQLPTSGGNPGPRNQHCAVYDPVNNRMIVFGGAEYLSDTWSLSLSGTPTWTNLTATDAPSGRKAMSAIYDPPRHRVLMFGGYDGAYKNDVWALTLYSPMTWTQLTVANPPPSGRMFTCAVYDPVRDRMIVFGGHPEELNDVWALSLSGAPEWTQIFPAGAPPSPRYGHVGVYDPGGDRLVIFGGSHGSDETWALSLSGTPTWTQIATTSPKPSGQYSTAVYDGASGRMVMYGGTATPSDVWALNLSASPSWSRLTPSGSLPPGRYLHTAVYQPSTEGRMIVYGGIGLGPEVWALTWDQTTPTTTSLAVSPNPVSCDGEVTLSVTVNPPGSGNGLIRIYDGSTLIESANSTGNGVVVHHSGFLTGTHSLTATYLGTFDYLGSNSSAVGLVVQQVATTTTLAADPNPSTFGQNVTFTATVSPSTVTGSVSFFLNGGGSPVATAPLSNGVATFQVANLPVGTSSVVASYGGDGCKGASSSQPYSQVVARAGCTLALNAAPSSVAAGYSVTLTATITPASPTGAIEFFDGASSVGTASLSNGVANLTLTDLPVGAHSITASYPGDANYTPATSPTKMVTVLSPFPQIVKIRDVPNDEGGRVYLTWKCLIDASGFQIVTGYRVWRRIPPDAASATSGATSAGASRAVGRSFVEKGRTVRMIAIRGPNGVMEETFWEAIASLPAERLVNYGYTAPTTEDAMPSGPIFTAFFVTALTSDPFTFYESAVDSGYSIDNVAPHAPYPLFGAFGNGGTALHWEPSNDADLAGYRLYRGAAPNFVPGDENLIASLSDTGYVDVGPPGNYYQLAAVDVHGNVGPTTSLAPGSTTAVGDPHDDVLGLRSVGPNPSHGGVLQVEFTLPGSVSATLELFDLTGRAVERRDVGGFGSGLHSVALGENRALRTGVYVVRLRTDAGILKRTVAVIR